MLISGMDWLIIDQQPDFFDLFQNITSFALGQHHIIALSSTGKVYGIGRGDYGRLGLGDATAEIDECVFL